MAAMSDGDPTEPAAENDWLVVGVGASAGGLQALQQFFSEVGSTPGVAFVVVTHQHPGHVSMLPQLIGRHTALPVVEAAQGDRLLPDHIYVASPHATPAIASGAISLREPDGNKASRLPIDEFFRSLAADLSERAAAVVLSGTGTDGSIGAAAIKAAGGLVVVQAPETAEHAGMPNSAIAAGVADWVLPPARMMEAIAGYAARRSELATTSSERIPAEQLARILELLRRHTGRDFTAYKGNTIRRRTARRMAVLQAGSAEQYVQLLTQDPEEIQRLFKDLLIGVTSFFRDPDIWSVLDERVIEPLLRERAALGLPSMRVWVPGCSTGEEAYSLAILVSEVAARIGVTVELQVFATDLDVQAIEVARRGTYPASIAEDVGPRRLERFFVAEDARFRVRSEIRERVVFAPHDLLSDPPFTRIDLLSCRNVLIYMDPALQQRILGTFHYALGQDGTMLLGSSETIGRQSARFVPVDARARIFRRVGAPLPVRALRDGAGQPSHVTAVNELSRESSERTIADNVSRVLVTRYTPPSIVINDRGDIVHIHGRTGDYLEPAPGRPSHNAFAMARSGMKRALTSAVRQALDERVPVRVRGVEVKTSGGVERVTVAAEVLAHPSPLRGLVLVSFQAEGPAAPSAAPDGERAPEGPVEDRVKELELELLSSHDHLQRTIEELEGSNEELQSMNEELQSANEELETSKEEMNSLNEELQTVNYELQQKVQALSQVNDDMDNLLNSTEIPAVFLDRDLRIKRFTRPARSLIHLIDGDVGRPLADLASTLAHDDLTEYAERVLRDLAPVETEVQTTDGRDHLLRILPYRTADNVIDGVVVTFIDVSELNAAKARSELARSIVEAIRHPLLVLDRGLTVKSASSAFFTAFAVNPADVVDASLYRICERALDVPPLHLALDGLLERKKTLADLRLELTFPGLGELALILNARTLPGPQPERILLAIDVAPAT